jgi:hypothetical protein
LLKVVFFVKFLESKLFLVSRKEETLFIKDRVLLLKFEISLRELSFVAFLAKDFVLFLAEKSE